MTRFAFIIHPIAARDVAKKYPVARFLPDTVIEAIMRPMRPKLLSTIRGIKSKTGAETEGMFIGLPFTPRQMTKSVPLDVVYDKIVACADLAAANGAEIIGLGAFTSVVGDGGVTVARRASIAVTTGNSYTVATAIQGTVKACGLVGVDVPRAKLAVVGATGSIGKTCAMVLGRQFAHTVLVGRNLGRTQAVAAELPGAEATTSIEALADADAIVTVTSDDAEIIMPENLKPGAVVCDVARPRDVSMRVARERPDVLVIEGGVVRVPGNVDFGLNFGFPPHTAYACMSETMMLALEDRPESFTLGKDVSVAQVDETIRLAEKHGFELAGFRSFERAVDDAAIERARSARAKSASAA
ncbi:MAG: shikimate dehydrogenase [Fimbriimonadaceae bacterium]